MVVHERRSGLRLPTISTLPVPRRLADIALNYRSGARPLAEPPAGSGLRPVPGDRGLPLLGHGLEWLRYGPEFERARYERYGPVSWMTALGVRMATVAGPDATQAVLVNKDKAFSQTGWEVFFDPFFRKGLLLLDFDTHLMHRRIMQEAFTRPRLASYTEVAGRAVRSGLPSWPEQLLFYPAVKRLTLDIAARVFTANTLAANERITGAFIDALQASTALVRFPIPGGRWRAGLRGRRVLEDFFREHLPAKRVGTGEDLFTALAQVRDEDGQAFSDEDVINHMIFLMLAAHDTTATTITAAAYYLATHPEWQERARAESLALSGSSIDDLDQLSTLDLVIKESLRLVAPLPSYVRKTIADTDVLGYHLPAGTITVVMPAPNHYAPEYWTNPLAFDPERFAEPRREDKSHRYAWLPFGGGVHKCIGLHLGVLEVKTVLHELLLRHRWSVPAGYTTKWDWANAPRPVDGLPITLTPLTQNG